MSEHNMMMFLQKAVQKPVNATAAGRVIDVKGTTSLTDIFAELEQLATKGIVEYVTYESVGMTADV
jgi:hypothetical protein